MGLSSKQASGGSLAYFSQNLEDQLEVIPKPTNAEPTKERKGPPLKCPRCDSANTKFCYYNNYSKLQPRHFCRACKRHWTAGGTLRNVPVGSATRKNNSNTKRQKVSHGSTNVSESNQQILPSHVDGDIGDSISAAGLFPSAFAQVLFPQRFPQVQPETSRASTDEIKYPEEIGMLNLMDDNWPSSYCNSWDGINIDSVLD